MTRLILANPLFSLMKNSVGASPGKVGVRFFLSEISVLALKYLCSDKTQETLDLGLEVEMTDASEKLGFEGGGWRQARRRPEGKAEQSRARRRVSWGQRQQKMFTEHQDPFKAYMETMGGWRRIGYLPSGE